jgi:transcriptional regulator with XRE-family HTH domain
MPATKKSGLRHRKKPDPLAAKLGARIKKLRKKRELRFDAWVEELGLGRGYVSELERGLVVPSLTALARVARVLDLSLSELVAFDRTEEKVLTLVDGLDDEELRQVIELMERFHEVRSA